MRYEEFKGRKAKYGVRIITNFSSKDHLTICQLSNNLHQKFPLEMGTWFVDTKNSYGTVVTTYYSDNINFNNTLLKLLKELLP